MRYTANTSIVLLSALLPIATCLAGAGPHQSGYRCVADFGALADGKTPNTAAIQKAIDETSLAGGGTLFFPAGRWLTGGLVLKDHVTLHLDNGAVLLGSTDLSEYPRHAPAYRSYSDSYVNQALIYAENAHDIAVVGRGTIDGQGGHPVFTARSDKSDSGYLRRPYLLRFVTCERIHVEGLTLRDSPMWTQQYLACDNVTIVGITVAANVNTNNDMIDIDGCRDVRMTGCVSDTEDDAITLKSTGSRLCENVTISDCTVGSHCNGIKLGTETTGGFRNIAITNIAVRPSKFGVKYYGHPKGTGGISLMIVDGGTLENVAVSNIVIEGTQAPLFIRLGNRARKHVPDAPAPGIGKLRNVTISNVVATGAARLGSINHGLPDHPIENLTLRDNNITTQGGGTLEQVRRMVPEAPEAYPECTNFGTMPAYGLYIRHVRGLTLDNIRFGFDSPDQRPAILCDDVSEATISGLVTQAINDPQSIVYLRDCSSIAIHGSVAPRTNGPFLYLGGTSQNISVLGNDLSRATMAWKSEGAVNDHEFHTEGNILPPGRE